MLDFGGTSPRGRGVWVAVRGGVQDGPSLNMVIEPYGHNSAAVLVGNRSDLRKLLTSAPQAEGAGAHPAQTSAGGTRLSAEYAQGCVVDIAVRELVACVSTIHLQVRNRITAQHPRMTRTTDLIAEFWSSSEVLFALPQTQIGAVT